MKNQLYNPPSGSSVSDEAYGASWDGVTTIAPSKNAVYDKIQSLGGGHDAVTLSVEVDTLFSLSTQQITLDNQVANKVFAGPTSGADAKPTFRLLVAADIPDLSATYILGSRLDDTKGNGDTTYIWSADKVYDQLALKLNTSQLDDTKGNGDTTYIWSADKCYDQLALKANLASPTFTGTVTVPMVALNPAPADTEASGIIAAVTVGENVVRGDILYLKSDGKYWKAKADAATTIPCVAIALGTINANNSGNVMFTGYLRDDTAYNWTVGGLLYVSKDTAGVITQTRPSATGNQVQIIGYAVTADIIFFNPNYTYVEIA